MQITLKQLRSLIKETMMATKIDKRAVKSAIEEVFEYFAGDLPSDADIIAALKQEFKRQGLDLGWSAKNYQDIAHYIYLACESESDIEMGNIEAREGRSDRNQRLKVALDVALHPNMVVIK